MYIEQYKNEIVQKISKYLINLEKHLNSELRKHLKPGITKTVRWDIKISKLEGSGQLDIDLGEVEFDQLLSGKDYSIKGKIYQRVIQDLGTKKKNINLEINFNSEVKYNIDNKIFDDSGKFKIEYINILNP